MKATTAFILGVLALSATSAKVPSIMWGSKGVVEKAEIDSKPYASTSAFAQRGAGLAHVYFVETGDNDFSARSLSTDRSAEFAAAIPALRVEGLYTAGFEPGTTCLHNKETLYDDIDAAITAGNPAYVCVDYRTDGPAVIADVTKHMEGRDYVAVYSAVTVPEDNNNNNAVDEEEEETTIWSGAILSGVFAFLCMFLISGYMMRLMLSLQSQPFTDIPKQKQI